MNLQEKVDYLLREVQKIKDANCGCEEESNSNNIFQLHILEGVHNPSTYSIEEQVNILPAFVVGENFIKIFKVKELDPEINDLFTENFYILAKGAGNYGVGEVSLTGNDFIKIDEDFQGRISQLQIDLNIVETDLDDLAILVSQLIGVSDTNTTSIGAGIDIYKQFNPVTEKHEIRTIESVGTSGEDMITLMGDTFNVAKVSSSTLIINKEADGRVTIETPTITSVKSFYVNNSYTGTDVQGTIAKPYKDLDTALAEYIGTGDIVSPQYNTSRIVVQPSGTNYNFNTNLAIRDLKIEVQSGAIINYIGSASDYALDTRLVHTHLNYDNTSSTFIQLFGEGGFYSTKGIIYAEGTGADGITAFNQTAILIRDNIKFSQSYDINNTTLVPITNGGTDYIKNGAVDINFYQGNSNTLPAIVLDKDNGNAVNLSLSKGATLSLSTQTGILIKNEGYLLQNRLATEAITVSNISTYGIYGGLENVGVGNPNVLIPNEDFNFIRIEGERTVCSVQNIFMSTVSAHAKAAIKVGNLLTPINASAISLVINKGTFFSTEEFNHAIYVEDVPHTLKIKNVVTSVASKEEAIKFNSPNTSISIEVSNCDIDKPLSSNIDLTKNNTVSVENRLEGKIVKSLQKFIDRATAATVLPAGGQFINTFNNHADTANHFLDTVI